jgi:5-methylcytosine-specific restriction endonuclease McrA
MEIRTCLFCEQPYTRDQHHPSRQGMSRSPRFCSAECRAGWRRRARALRRLARRCRDGVTAQQVFDRDGWTCMIPGCGQPIQPGLEWPDPMSVSVDHIIPRSLGGDDTAENRRAAHLVCNVRRGNRMHPDDVQVTGPVLVPLALELSRQQQERQHQRQREVLIHRSRGMRWADIAGVTGLSGPGAAHNAATRPSADAEITRLQDAVFRKPARKPGRSSGERLWWTTVRPD